MKKKILITGVIGIVVVGGIIAFTSYNKKDLNNEVEAINNSISSSSDETSSSSSDTSSLPVSSQENLTTDEFLIESGTDEQGRPVAGVDEKAIEEEIKKIEQEAGLPDGIPDEVQKLIDELEENPNKYSESDTSTPSTPSTPETPSTPSQPSNNSNNSSNSGGGNVWVPSDPEQAKAIEEAAQDTGGGITDEIKPGDHDAARPELWN